MNPNQLKRLFPNASASVMAANKADYGSGTPTESPQSVSKAHLSPETPKAAQKPNPELMKALGALLTHDHQTDHPRETPKLECDSGYAPLAAGQVQEAVDQDNESDYLRRMKLDVDQLFETYLRTGSVHKTAIEFNTCGETVRRRLIGAGKPLNRTKWNDEEISKLRTAYASPLGFDLSILSRQLKRTHAAVACKADDLGICSNRGKHIRTELAIRNTIAAQIEIGARPEIKKARSKSTKDMIQRIGHPRGMLGKHHREESKQKISEFHAGKKRRPEDVLKGMKTKFANGTLFKNRPGSWKAAWREIGGRRIFARSRWEANYARYLEWLKTHGEIKEWEHEPETFWFEKIRRGCRSYLPDFRVTINSGTFEYHETKGWMDARSITKIKRMKRYYPSVILIVRDSAWFRANQRKLRGLIQGWEHSK